MRIETVEVNGVRVNKGDEASAAKWAVKKAKGSEVAEVVAEDGKEFAVAGVSYSEEEAEAQISKKKGKK